MIGAILVLFLLTVLQNMSFTLLSRARNSGSILYNGIASAASNTIYVLLLSKLVTHLDSFVLMATFVFGSVVGNVLMHYIALKYIEKKKHGK